MTSRAERATAALPAPVTARLEADARVLGAAQPAGSDLAFAPGVELRLVIACRYDAHAGVIADLPGLLAPEVDLDGARSACDGTGLRAITKSGVHVVVDVTPMSLLRPDARGEGARVLVDRTGAMDQWVRWSAGRPAETEDTQRLAAECALSADRVLRALASETVTVEPRRDPIDRWTAQLDPDHGVDAALLRAAADLRALRPVPGAGLTVHAGVEPGGAFESFLAVADAEGFRGDRVLFERARDLLSQRPGAHVTFEAGWCLPTFDAVAVRFALGPPVGGCKVPLAPAVAVGVEVTAADDLAFWAAPAVREAAGTFACVKDDGERTVLARDAGRDAFFAALDHCVTTAADDVPDLLARARGAARERLDDLETALRATHLPLSHRTRVLRRLGGAALVTRLELALALTRSARDEGALGAAKLSWAAGRVLAVASPAAPDAC